VDVVYGHSAHHPLPIEVYRDRLILYGCGDLIDDHEGISGYEQYRNDLRLLYLASFESGALSSLRIAPMQARRMQLHRASRADTEWLCNLLGSISGRPFAIDQDSMLAPAC
jgi:poly-gamma-glutamate capsule biosynthesis protein CapA/YwtB (metallophosphatase superfamily)